jgi:hypothetical protein
MRVSMICFHRAAAFLTPGPSPELRVILLTSVRPERGAGGTTSCFYETEKTIWTSKLQDEIFDSQTEGEFVCQIFS